MEPRTGPGVNLYAPGEDMTIVAYHRSTTSDSGTSFAAPLVSGTVAMMLNVEPTPRSSEVKSILLDTADIVQPAAGGPAIRRLN